MPCLESALALVSASDAFEPPRERDVALHSAQCVERERRSISLIKNQESMAAVRDAASGRTSGMCLDI